MKKFILLIAFSLCSYSAVANEDSWRLVAPENMLLLELEYGNVVIELKPEFAPKNIAEFKRLIKTEMFNDAKFYRVVDGFVAQAGPKPSYQPRAMIPLEATKKLTAKDNYVAVETKDMFADETGFIDGFAVGVEDKSNQSWLLHCPGTVAMARSTEPNTAAGDFYAVIGQAPRYLDRNMSVIGRVVYGLEYLQKLDRFVITDEKQWPEMAGTSEIKAINLMADLPKDKQIQIEVWRTESKEFQSMLDSRRKRSHDFFIFKPKPVLDVCQVPNQGRLAE
ncbi:peptidylprolyl isomerase [Thalassotalea crassostreae]|uniref:peptidylprolyl isomerase n=1 Tax=Thalassotalea crassostreae TaxID=1763536 RepID=UPI000AF6AABF|nr:peptidylprolyl isomerase [Thalassotalea crassostreae]